MGIIRPQNIMITASGNAYKHLLKSGYNVTYQEKISVDIDDLTNGSNAVVAIQCDYCGMIFYKPYGKYNKLEKCACKNCKGERVSDGLNAKIPHAGDRFWKLTFIERNLAMEKELKLCGGKRSVSFTKQGLWRCDCGTVKNIPIKEVRQGRVKSCGCLAKGDLTGKCFNNLEVVSQSSETPVGKSGVKMYLCKCTKCGKGVTLSATYLKSGKAIDCGCGHQERMSKAHLHDLTGMQFGHLHVIERSYSVGYASGQGIHSHWLCLCDLCNRVTTVNSWSLTGRGKDRCDECLKQDHHSSGELKIMELLDSNNVKYECEYRPDGCVFPDTNSQLRFDFLVHSVVPFFIEYDGVQHFRPVGKWDEHIDYDGRVARDEFKNQWCANNKYKLIRIPYTHFNDLCIEDLFPETSAFCVTF